MRIQAINNNYNQNNISHKAHFKPNEHLEKICKRAKKSSQLSDYLYKFKNNLPKHELEISSYSEKGLVSVGVKNNTTSKLKVFLCVNDKNTLLSLLHELCLTSNKSFFDKNVSEDIDCLDYLTNTDYVPEIKK